MGAERVFDLRLSSPRVSGYGRGEPLYWLADEEDSDDDDEVWRPVDEDGGEAGSVHRDQAAGSGPSRAAEPWWPDAHRWRPPRPGDATELPPRWLGVMPRRTVRPATTTPAPRPVQVFRLACVLPTGGVVACVMRADSPDAEWVQAAWEAKPSDVV